METSNLVEKKYKIGIALSGGGIKGLCHAGALKALEEFGIKPDIISGASAGAIVGSLYADGYTPDEIADFFHNMTFREMTKIQFQGGVFQIEQFEKFLDNKLRSKTFEELKIPLKVVATNLDEGKSVVFCNGTLTNRVIASSTVPILFTPKNIEGTYYVDGGVLKNFPASVIRNECEMLVGINASPLVAAEYKLGIVSVAMRSYHFMQKSNTFHDKELCDILIEPIDMGNYDTFDTGKSKEIFNVGYMSTKAILEKEDCLLNKKEWLISGNKLSK